jgi:AraC family transcriptional regulator
MHDQNSSPTSLNPFRSTDRSLSLSGPLHGVEVQLAELSGNANHGLTAPQPQSASYIVQLRLVDCVRCDMFVDGRYVQKNKLSRAGLLDFHDQLMLPRADLHDPFNLLLFQVPRRVLADSAYEMGCSSDGELHVRPGFPADDAIARHLLLGIRPALASPLGQNRLFVEQAFSALSAHLVRTYASCKPLIGGRVPRLSPWQASRMREMIDASLDDQLSLEALAAAIGLSVPQLSRRFQESFGMPPFRYQMRCRVGRAQQLLRNRRLRLIDVAVESGFATQSHFGRVFKQMVGQSPGQWRREQRVWGGAQ